VFEALIGQSPSSEVRGRRPRRAALPRARLRCSFCQLLRQLLRFRFLRARASGRVSCQISGCWALPGCHSCAPGTVRAHSLAQRDRGPAAAVQVQDSQSPVRRQVYRARHKRTGELFAVKRVVRKLRNKADRERCASQGAPQADLFGFVLLSLSHTMPCLPIARPRLYQAGPGAASPACLMLRRPPRSRAACDRRRRGQPAGLASTIIACMVHSYASACPSGALRPHRGGLSAPAARARRCLHEIQAVAALPEHPHIVRYYRAWQQRREFYLQMALCENGSLASLLRAAARRAAAALQLYACLAHVAGPLPQTSHLFQLSCLQAVLSDTAACACPRVRQGLIGDPAMQVHVQQHMLASAVLWTRPSVWCASHVRRARGARQARRGRAGGAVLARAARGRGRPGLPARARRAAPGAVPRASGARSPPAVCHWRRHAARLTLCLIQVLVRCWGRLNIGAAADAQGPKPNPKKAGGRRAQDIKLGNIFLDAAGTFQIGDFGLAVLRRQWVRRCFIAWAARRERLIMAGLRALHAAVRGAPATAAVWNGMFSYMRCQHTVYQHGCLPVTPSGQHVALSPSWQNLFSQGPSLFDAEPAAMRVAERTPVAGLGGGRRRHAGAGAAGRRRAVARQRRLLPGRLALRAGHRRAPGPPSGTPCSFALKRAPGLAAAPSTLRAHALSGHGARDNICMWRRFTLVHDPRDALECRCASGHDARRQCNMRQPGG